MCFYDVEPCDALLKVRPRARKDHTCSECHEIITAGTVYTKTTGIFDGDPFTHKECRRCSWDRRRIREHEEAEGCESRDSDPGFFGLRHGLQECGLDPTSPEAVPLDFLRLDRD
jgi:hypothetical protein